MPYLASDTRYNNMLYNRVGYSGLKLPAISLGWWYNFGGRDKCAIGRAIARRAFAGTPQGDWLSEFWVPHRSELLRIAASDVDRIDAERDYVRLHVVTRSYLLLQTVTGLEARLDPDRFIRLHRSTILRRDRITGLRHDGLGVWSAELADGSAVRIGRTYLAKAKAMAGRWIIARL
jgi:two-component system response regulator AlgR